MTSLGDLISLGEFNLSDDYSILGLTEDTMDVGIIPNPMSQEVRQPISPRGPPGGTCSPGALNFSVEVNSKDCHKKKFLYSHKLHRIYVDMGCDFSVSFNWHQLPSTKLMETMFVRATVVFSEAEQCEKRVERCLQHYHQNNESHPEMAKHVLLSSREPGTQGVHYCGGVTSDCWYSVLVEFNRMTTEPCTHAYKFTCKSSCASGINRRATDIVFTLEDIHGTVHGRQKVGVKVCAVIRRDMHRDEEGEGVKSGKRRCAPRQVAQPNDVAKKVKREVQNNTPTMVMLPRVEVELNAMLSGFRGMVDMMTNGGLHDPGVVDLYAPSIANLKNIIKQFEGEGTLPQE